MSHNQKGIGIKNWKKQRPMNAEQLRDYIRSGRYRLVASQMPSRTTVIAMEEKRKAEKDGGDLSVRAVDGAKVEEAVNESGGDLNICVADGTKVGEKIGG